MRISSPASSGRRRSPRHPKENLDPNPLTPSFRAKTKSPLPPRPPLHPNPLKRKLNLEPDGASDSGVKVVLRTRPLGGEEDEDSIVKKVSDDSVAVAEHLFTFDWIAESGSTQREIFDLVGLPLVENCLAGFNSSIFAYGQTGSGKTYTMWGPLAALSKDEMASEERGLTPRVFERLFTRIEEDQIKHSAKQLSYQCKCSFLEIYNEQITDLLNPSHGNLQIREDVRTGIYVENLMEEYVCSTKDVIQLLRKGLENKKTGATSINAESSRSHCVFTCIVESRSKCISNGLSSVRTSRINLVDLAGSERQKQTGAAGERLKEAGNINRSLSQLGNLINILAEVSQSGKQRHIPYRDSKLTFLLQESLGGNAKLAMICTVSPSESCKSETFSTLRFAKRAKAIKNKAIVNEVTQDDVHVLREQIRQLKDELVRVKSLGNASGNNGNYSTGWDARRSLAILRQSLSRPLPTQPIEDNDEEMEIDDADVEKPFINEANSSQLAVSAETDADAAKLGIFNTASNSSSADPVKDLNIVEMEICEPENVVKNQSEPNPDVRKFTCLPNGNKKMVDQEDSKLICSSEVTIEENASLTLHENILNEDKPQNENLCSDIELPICNLSPDSEHLTRKSLKTSSLMTASQKVFKGTGKLDSGSLGTSSVQTLNKNNSQIPTERLAKSLHRGLELFEFHEQQSTMRRSAFVCPQKPINVMPALPVAKVDCGVQTLPDGLRTSEGQSSDECNYCKCKNAPHEYKDASVETELQLTPSDSSHLLEKSRKQVPKAVEKVLAGAIRREMALEDHCVKQASEIAHLNRLVQQYKHERECNIVIEQTREGKIARLEGLMDGIIPAEHYMEEEFKILANEYKLLKDKYENHPEVLRVLIELKRVQDELEGYRNFFELGERDVLMEEIQDLRCQLQYYVDCPTSQKRGSLLKLAYDNNTCSKLIEECPDEKFEEERRCWTETEGKWISLAEDLRVELETTRSLAEKQKVELDSERKCLAELKEALQSAMQCHARMLEQYADLQEKHVQLLAKHRKIRDGITDVKKAAAKAGIKGAEIKFIDALAAEISTLKAEREKEKRYWKDENKGLQAQLRDTAEALQAAGELLVRLKEAEEAAKLAQNRISAAEKDAEKSRREMNDLKKKHEAEISLLNQHLAESQLPKEVRAIKYDNGESLTDKTWRVEFEQFDQVNENDFSRGAEHHSWFSDYDRCNI